MGIDTTYYFFIGQTVSGVKETELIELTQDNMEVKESYSNTYPLFKYEGETYFYEVDMGSYTHFYKCLYYIGESEEQSDLIIDYKKFPKNIEEPCNFYCIPIMM